MGYERHHAIVVSAFYHQWITDEKKYPKDVHWIDVAHAKAVEFGCQVTEILKTKTNDVRSFMIGPDGSKEGWATSNEGDKNRKKFIEWIRSFTYDDGSNPIHYVEVSYGGDDENAKITRSSEKDEKAFRKKHSDWATR